MRKEWQIGVNERDMMMNEIMSRTKLNQTQMKSILGGISSINRFESLKNSLSIFKKKISGVNTTSSCEGDTGLGDCQTG